MLVKREDSGEWAVVKVLVVDVWPDGGELLHCLMYRSTSERPTPDVVAGLEVLAYHAPLRATAFRGAWEVLGTCAVAPADLVGFHEYLKRVDFRRYLAETGQNLETVVARANSHFAAGGALNDQQRHREAIEEYTRAADLFPLFYEAIDNRGFSYMNIGDYRSALDDFEHSLQIHPDGEAAYFSSGECLLRLGKLDEAEAIFEAGAVDSTQYRELHQKFLGLVRDLRGDGLPSTG
ncbi:tetratricopeptide repeat protein [Nocardia sp. JCM 34519.1]|uniref:tetratricopeptide repeat protein n=1 Tax=Nocardia sp. JCM 34519.1 TaxID=2876119 RepID=UPI001CE3CD53|nr:tetratricopeptide repeat protein [Nocardia sp. JCM 34519.1]